MIRFFCLAWGDHFTDMLERVLLRSFMQPRNATAIPSDCVVSLYSNKASMEKVSTLAAKIGKVEPHIIDTTSGEETQHKALRQEVRICYETDATLIMLCPDSFWGDGSLGNLLTIAGKTNNCIAAPHVRVDEKQFLNELPDCTFDNQALVARSFKTLHKSWVDADADKPVINSFYAGVSWRRLGEGLYAVTHRVPTIWLARFTEKDMEFFERDNASGIWDHYWPEELVRSERQRVIGSSDAFFIAELTNASTHSTLLHDNDGSNPDQYFRPAVHTSTNRNVTAIWRY